MKWLLIAFFGFSAFLLSAALLQYVFLSDRRLQGRIQRYLELGDKRKLGRRQFGLLVQLQLYKQTIREKVLTRKKKDRLEDMLGRAGLELRPEEYILLQWVAAALLGGVLLLATGSTLALFLGAGAGYLLPRWVVKSKEQERIAKFNDGLQDMITTIIGSLRAGFSFAQALKTVVDESEDPIRGEMEIVLKEMQYGTTMEEALLRLKERMPSGDLDLMVQCILIQRQVGGNLAVVLETIVQTIRDRSKIQRQIRTLTAQGRLSGIVIGLLPLVLGVLIYVIEPDYIGSLFHHPVGLLMVGAGVFSGIIGFVLIRKMTTIEV
ncbi:MULTISPECIES: type II secretion system F family protein [Paenibacillus]|uniref:type II secretion system F family protein n=1 Tax=Paenibacillus TaxID=44249 RepID=UPI0022B8B33A|nr:type II secretion system F family protein [Paenibacillus caseinilyticus]MCZ8521592.1 type II secretion system F family protein [Paenibacillus caseinilyticus]